MALNKVCLVGGNGNLGTLLLDGLVKAGDFSVTIAKRASSKSTPAHADSITQITVPDDMSLEGLTEALRGQDVVIASFPLVDVNQHLRLVEAASKAGVKRFIPADFGSCDAASPNARRLLKLYRDKDLVRHKCEEIAAANPDFSWTALVCGHFFDFGVHDGLLHLDLEKKTADILDDGTVKASASTLRRVAQGTIAALRRPEQTRNRTLYIQSFNKTQLEVVEAIERVTGVPWTRRTIDSKAYVEEASRKLEAEYSKHVMEEIVFVLGALEADWTKEEGFAMELLGLEDENLDEVLAEVVAGMGK
jgi:nucleoside-diphosphate-sugar epimerase